MPTEALSPDSVPDSKPSLNDQLETSPEVTEQDRDNAEMRQTIAAQQEAEVLHCQMLTLRSLGPGWEPSMRLTLVRVEDCRPTGKNDPDPERIAVAYRVSRGEGEDRLVRFVRETPSGKVLVSDRHEDVFKGLLDEKHPTKTMEIKGQQVPCKRYQLYWSVSRSTVPARLNNWLDCEYRV